ncbi:MAG: hypothetical protein U0894_04390 [Pirellulales bacterium]
MPFTQSVGRDHNGGTFFVTAHGRGLKAELGCERLLCLPSRARQNGDLLRHAIANTVLHLLEADHEKLSVCQNGIDRRLTDVHGHVLIKIPEVGELLWVEGPHSARNLAAKANVLRPLPRAPH